MGSESKGERATAVGMAFVFRVGKSRGAYRGRSVGEEQPRAAASDSDDKATLVAIAPFYPKAVQCGRRKQMRLQHGSDSGDLLDVRI
jgi:hypothetical protein